MDTDPARRQQLGDHVRRRRLKLGLTLDHAAEAAPMSSTTWSRVEQGKKVRDLSYSGVDRVLRWPDGASIEFLRTGTEPQPIGEDAGFEDSGDASTAGELTIPEVPEAVVPAQGSGELSDAFVGKLGEELTAAVMAALSGELRSLRREMRDSIAALRTELRGEITDLREEMRLERDQQQRAG